MTTTGRIWGQRRASLLASLGCLLAMNVLIGQPDLAHAQCTRAERPTTVGDSEINLRVYNCATRGLNARVEFHRLSTGAVSHLVAGRVPDGLRAMVGNSRIEERGPWREYAVLLDQFGTTHVHSFVVVRAVASGGGESDRYYDDSYDEPVRSLFMKGGFYPAINELEILERGGRVDDLERRGDQLWRFMTRDDFRQYSERLRALNQAVFEGRSEIEISDPNDRTIDLVNHLTRKNPLPPDFMVITGRFHEVTCGGGRGWHFYSLNRVIIMDVMTIENLSDRPLEIDSLLGTRTTGGLRSPSPAGQDELLGLTDAIQPGERVIVPLQMAFAPPDYLRPYTSSTYIYGSALALSGFVGNGQRVLFEERRANYIEMSAWGEEGSCPYLQAYNEDIGDWVDHGKILHTARSADQVQTHELRFPGLRTRFRLEEREPEVAFIDAAELTLELTDGRTIALTPDLPELDAIDGEEAVFRWGETVAFNYAVPEGLAAEDVRQTTLKVTGHYLTYSSLASMAQPPIPFRASLLTNATHAPEAIMCPISIDVPYQAGTPTLAIN